MSTKPDTGLPYRNFRHSGQQLFNSVNTIPQEAAKDVAALFYKIAEELMDVHRVYEHRKSIREATRRRQFELRQIPVEVSEKMASGMSFEDAVQFLNDFNNIPRETVYSYWLKHVKRTEETAREVRDGKIFDLHRRGVSTSIIADDVGLSTRQVQRIIREQKKVTEIRHSQNQL
ncbi:hypothetical protein [Emcibacter nanhaiensis]|uniref:Uncharacterized protein n=1 Tax=Emcibacter nanhaiensis TaxID=1505037 RepID=A0A501PR36_9PROT|nr:hypothetical protein [Emcibacter nanhaiensis]TPD62990.1 hypothetical protein FIV46_02615 [Emcibacter nanhaiensis]